MYSTNPPNEGFENAIFSLEKVTVEKIPSRMSISALPVTMISPVTMSQTLLT